MKNQANAITIALLFALSAKSNAAGLTEPPLAGTSAMSCMRTTIASIHPPVSAAWAGNGGMTFADHYYAVLFANPDTRGTIYSGSWKTMRKGDRVLICISREPKRCPLQHGHHTIIVQDLDRPAKFSSTTGASGMADPCELSAT